MSAPLVVNTTDGTCWTRRSVTRGGIALYALEGVCSCPEFVMATLPELEEHGIAGTADVLPVPVGPQMPDFPPPPRTELEKLRAERARLQGLLAEAVRDAHLARRERDLIRERVSEPFGCKHCGEVKRSHGRRYIGGAGMHSWERPSDEQVKDRMLARRAARFPSSGERLAQLLVARTEDLLTAEARIAELEAQREADHKTWQHDLSTARSEREAMAARIAELEAEPLAWAWKLDAKSLDNFLIALGSFSEHEPMDEAVDRIHELLRSYREATSVDGITWRIAPTQALREDEAAPLTVYRASHDSIVMGHYTTREAAQAHCEAKVRQEEPEGSILHMSWSADDIGPEAEYELHITPAETGGLIRGTGYVVTPVEVASEYDEEADE